MLFEKIGGYFSILRPTGFPDTQVSSLSEQDTTKPDILDMSLALCASHKAFNTLPIEARPSFVTIFQVILTQHSSTRT